MKCLTVICVFIACVVQGRSALNVGNRGSAKNAAGLEIETLDAGSVFEKLGLKQGDVIQTINGKPATPESFSDISELMKAPGKIEIEVLRKGSVQKMTYNIK